MKTVTITETEYAILKASNDEARRIAAERDKLRDAARYAESVFRAHNECRDHSLGMEKAVERLAEVLRA